MCIYCATNNYRKIYEHHYGAIPKDDQGRSYHIHHIDGDHKNNDPNNLQAVSLQDHYNIHKSQGDWGACVMLAQKFSMTQEDLQQASKESALRRIREGTHHFVDPEWRKIYVESELYHERRSAAAKLAQGRRTAEGRNPFTGGEIQRRSNRLRVEAGTHHFLSGAQQREAQNKLVADGTHIFQSENHPGVVAQRDRLENNCHHLQLNNPNKVKVTCPHCSKVGGQVNMKRYHFDKCKLNPNKAD